MAASIYKKYVLFILCTFLALNLLSVLWLFTGYFNPLEGSAWIDSLYQKKEAFARSIHGPKIVIVSGSSGLFGISAAQIESYFKVPTVNLCTHGDLRDYYLHRAEKSINSGDLVILVPEYTQYSFDSPMSRIKSDYIVNFDKSWLKALPFDEKIVIFESYAHPWKLIKAKLFDSKEEKYQRKNVGYNSNNLNRNGDETSNYGTEGLFFEPVAISQGFDEKTDGMRKISEFIHWCGQKGARVIVTWPGTLPFKKIAQNFDAQFIDSLIAYLSNSDTEVLGNPEDFFVPHKYLFDSIYHLNADGVFFKTSKTIRLLEKSPTFTAWHENHMEEFDPVDSVFNPPQLLEICSNGSMEKSENNQPAGWKAITGRKINPAGFALWDNSEAHGGNYSLKLINTTSGQIRWVGEKVLLPPGSHMLVAGGWSKAENIEEHARYCIDLKTFFKDGSFEWNPQGLFFAQGTHDWTRVHAVFSFNEEVVAVQPFLILYAGTGTAWFDDIFIQIPSAGNLLE